MEPVCAPTTCRGSAPLPILPPTSLHACFFFQSHTQMPLTPSAFFAGCSLTGLQTINVGRLAAVCPGPGHRQRLQGQKSGPRWLLRQAADSFTPERLLGWSNTSPPSSLRLGPGLPVPGPFLSTTPHPLRYHLLNCKSAGRPSASVRGRLGSSQGRAPAGSLVAWGVGNAHLVSDRKTAHLNPLVTSIVALRRSPAFAEPRPALPRGGSHLPRVTAENVAV